MKGLAPGVWRLKELPAPTINVYLAGDVLIDAGRRWDRRRIFREVVFFRESDRVAICGDVIRNMSYATLLPGIREPPAIFTYDPAENRRSIRKLADLEPKLILPGHGPAVTDIAKFERFVAALG